MRIGGGWSVAEGEMNGRYDVVTRQGIQYVGERLLDFLRNP
jgi:hypothetical protein